MSREHHRAAFQSRVAIDDGYGNHVGGWGPTAFSCWVGMRFLNAGRSSGAETVLAGRLQGKQPVLITVRKNAQTGAINPDMRCIIDGRAYNIREFPRLTDDRTRYEFLAESGVADG